MRSSDNYLPQMLGLRIMNGTASEKERQEFVSKARNIETSFHVARFELAMLKEDLDKLKAANK